MTQAVDNILGTALNLSAEERAELATRLIRSLDGTDPTPEEQKAIDAAWAEEIDRRAAEIDNGTVKLIGGDEFLAKLRRLSSREPQP
jgi:putative addiction module component (TIGR02574 family)